jgi:hypothetical protein
MLLNASRCLYKLAIFIDFIGARAFLSFRKSQLKHPAGPSPSLPTYLAQHRRPSLTLCSLPRPSRRRRRPFVSLALAAAAALARCRAGGPALSLTHRGDRCALSPKSTTAPQTTVAPSQRRRTKATAWHAANGAPLGSGAAPSQRRAPRQRRGPQAATDLAALLVSTSFNATLGTPRQRAPHLRHGSRGRVTKL